MTSEEENIQHLFVAKKSIEELNVQIDRLIKLRDMWLKLSGKVEGDLYGRILP